MSSQTQRYQALGANTGDRQLWSPTDVLDLYEDGRCVGYAPSKGRKCRMLIYGNAIGFSHLLDNISQQRPDPEQLRSNLEELAELGLCRRFHQSQCESLVETWMRRIYSAFPPTVGADLQRTSAVRQQLSRQISAADRIAASPSSTSMSRPTSSRSSIVPLSEPSDPDSLRATIASMQETIRNAQECIERLSNTRSSRAQTPPITRTSTSDISSLALSRRSTMATDLSSTTSASSSSSSSSLPSTPSPSETTRVPRRLTLTYPQASPTPSSSSSSSSSGSPPSSPSLNRSCTLRHARRLPLPSECPICHSGPPLSSLPSSSLVWCKSRCGQTVHKDCFALWSAQRTRDHLSPTCVMCRTEWVDTCECEGCLHVSRREVEDDCAICREEMMVGEGGAAGALVWCKDGCGRSVHRDCFAVWETHCVEGGGRPTCVLCRTVWNEEGCGC